MPLVASSPLKAILTELVYQPLWSAARAGSPETFVGAVASYLKALEVPLVLLPALSVQLPFTVRPEPSGPL